MDIQDSEFWKLQFTENKILTFKHYHFIDSYIKRLSGIITPDIWIHFLIYSDEQDDS